MNRLLEETKEVVEGFLNKQNFIVKFISLYKDEIVEEFFISKVGEELKVYIKDNEVKLDTIDLMYFHICKEDICDEEVNVGNIEDFEAMEKYLNISSRKSIVYDNLKI